MTGACGLPVYDAIETLAIIKPSTLRDQRPALVLRASFGTALMEDAGLQVLCRRSHHQVAAK